MKRLLGSDKPRLHTAVPKSDHRCRSPCHTSNRLGKADTHRLHRRVRSVCRWRPPHRGRHFSDRCLRARPNRTPCCWAANRFDSHRRKRCYNRPPRRRSCFRTPRRACTKHPNFVSPVRERRPSAHRHRVGCCRRHPRRPGRPYRPHRCRHRRAAGNLLTAQSRTRRRRRGRQPEPRLRLRRMSHLRPRRAMAAPGPRNQRWTESRRPTSRTLPTST